MISWQRGIMQVHVHVTSTLPFFGLLIHYATLNSPKRIINASCPFLSFFPGLFRLINNAIALLRQPTPPLALFPSTLNLLRQDINVALLVPHKDFSRRLKSVRTIPVSSNNKTDLTPYLDFELIVSQDPTHALAQAALSNVKHEIPDSQAIPSAFPYTACTPFNTPATGTAPSELPSNGAIQLPTQLPTPTPTPPANSSEDLPPVDFAFPSPSPSIPPLYEPSLSDSSDCFHVGNGIPCRFYNTHPLGCGMGVLCRFSHSPDEKSVRDNLYASPFPL